LLLLIGPLAQMRTLQLIIQQFLGLLFMFLFLRSYKISRLASLFGAFVFINSGLMTTDFEFASGSKALIWLPLCLFLIQDFFQSKKNSRLVFLSFSYAFLLLSGHFQVTVYSSLIIGIFLLTSQAKAKFKPIVFLIAGIILSLPQLLP